MPIRVTILRSNRSEQRLTRKPVAAVYDRRYF